MEPTPRKSEIVLAREPGAPWLDHLAYPETHGGVTMRSLVAYLVDTRGR